MYVIKKDGKYFAGWRGNQDTLVFPEEIWETDIEMADTFYSKMWAEISQKAVGGEIISK